MSLRDDAQIDIDANGLIDEAQADWLRARVCEACAHAPIPVARLSLRVVADAEMAELHQRYSGVAGTTDVLTFIDSGAEQSRGDAASADPPGARADVALCVDEARRQATRRGHPLQTELLLYAVHALLHACGLNDAEEGEAAKMHHFEDRILTAMGIGAVYARGEPSE